MNFSKLWEIMEDRGAWHATVSAPSHALHVGAGSVMVELRASGVAHKPEPQFPGLFKWQC